MAVATGGTVGAVTDSVSVGVVVAVVTPGVGVVTGGGSTGATTAGAGALTAGAVAEGIVTTAVAVLAVVPAALTSGSGVTPPQAASRATNAPASKSLVLKGGN